MPGCDRWLTLGWLRPAYRSQGGAQRRVQQAAGQSRPRRMDSRTASYCGAVKNGNVAEGAVVCAMPSFTPVVAPMARAE